MPNVKGLLTDPRFQQLSVEDQKSVLGRIDSRFSNLSDGDFGVFKQRLAPPPDLRGLPPGQTAPPGVSAPALPKELQSQPEGKDMLEKLENGIHDGSFPGPNMVINGIKQLASAIPAFASGGPVHDNPNDGPAVARPEYAKSNLTRGAADVLEGAGKVASPLGVAATALAPAPGALALGGGMLGQKLAALAANKMGASPDAERLVGDLGGIAGGMGGAQIAPENPLTALQNAGAAIKGGAKGAAQGAAQTVKIGPTGIKLSPLEAIKGAYRGGKNEVANLNTQRLIQQARDNPRIPGWMLNQPSSPEAQAAAVPPVPSVSIPDMLPSGRKVGGIQNQTPVPPPDQPRISMVNGKAFLRNPKGQFQKAADMPAPNGSTDRIVVVGGKPYLNINGHLFDPKTLKK